MDSRIFIVIISIMILLPVVALGNNVVISEIAWMGQKDATAKEWIELFNPAEREIDLTDWKLKITKTEIILSGSIKPKSYYLLERSNDNAVDGQEADLIFKKALNNKGENIELSDNNGTIVDEVDCSKGWFAGDNKTKNTMERIDSAIEGSIETNWQNSLSPGGTPKREAAIKMIAEKKSDNNNMTATVSNNLFPVSPDIYLIAALMAIFSIIPVLAIKIIINKYEKYNR